mmetsp:Transcript_5527/g.24843  ORF Transcript_5527/g.24843 Transcript_5527/m.24843 type:complete len:224 (-) Transcript_5527:1693-2364(-)
MRVENLWSRGTHPEDGGAHPLPRSLRRPPRHHRRLRPRRRRLDVIRGQTRENGEEPVQQRGAGIRPHERRPPHALQQPRHLRHRDGGCELHRQHPRQHPFQRGRRRVRDDGIGRQRHRVHRRFHEADASLQRRSDGVVDGAPPVGSHRGLGGIEGPARLDPPEHRGDRLGHRGRGGDGLERGAQLSHLHEPRPEADPSLAKLVPCLVLLLPFVAFALGGPGGV